VAEQPLDELKADGMFAAVPEAAPKYTQSAACTMFVSLIVYP